MSFRPNDGDIALTNDQTCVCPKPDDRLLLPELDLSEAVFATMDYDLFYTGRNDETAEIWVSTDQGQTWDVSALATSNDWGNYRFFLRDYLGEESVQIAFVYSDNGGWHYGMGIDNVVVSANFVRKVDVATELAQDQHELGPNAKVDFFNEAGQNIGSLRNLGSNDFGCGSLSIDRAGTGATPFWSADNRAGDLMDKTFLLDVENPSATQDLELTLYYTAEEDAGWQAVTGRSLDQIRLVTHAGSHFGDNP